MLRDFLLEGCLLCVLWYWRSLQHPNSFCPRLEPSVYRLSATHCLHPILLLTHSRCEGKLMYLCLYCAYGQVCIFPTCLCVSKRDKYVVPFRQLDDDLVAWRLSLWPFRERRWEHKKLIVSRAGQQIIDAADACDKIMIRLLSGLHINPSKQQWIMANQSPSRLCPV